MIKEGRDHPEYRLKWLLFTAPLEAIGLFGFAWSSMGPDYNHWIAPLIFSALVGIANYAIYMATIDYMVAAYGPYAASATGGNGFARDFLAGIAALYATPRKYCPQKRFTKHSISNLAFHQSIPTLAPVDPRTSRTPPPSSPASPSALPFPSTSSTSRARLSATAPSLPSRLVRKESSTAATGALQFVPGRRTSKQWAGSIPQYSSFPSCMCSFVSAHSPRCPIHDSPKARHTLARLFWFN